MNMPTRKPNGSGRAEFAVFLAERLGVGSQGHVDAALIERLIGEFESASSAKGQRCRVIVAPEGEMEGSRLADSEKQAVVATLQGALPPAVLAAAGDSGARDPVLLAGLVADQSKDLGQQVQGSQLAVAMYKDLVEMLSEILPALEQTDGDQAVLGPARALLDRARAAQSGRGEIPASVSPMRILGTIESVSSAHLEILTRYGKDIDRDALVRGIRVVGEAARLLEEIHGSADGPELAEEDEDSPRAGM